MRIPGVWWRASYVGTGIICGAVLWEHQNGKLSRTYDWNIENVFSRFEQEREVPQTSAAQERVQEGRKRDVQWCTEELNAQAAWRAQPWYARLRPPPTPDYMGPW